ncbi:protein ALP1-like [Photinus pyralis]|uniref:DDE Tnp4 domain-containing protein n=2 Tax=Photinus pyralis TaxID=7054 RepID=A0A1Y1MNV8_PHOPY|nr:protein ALP1-like [Photinus pyralis]XP_031358523.1 protein ALP1-like [Photinus pyralis]
MEPVLLLNHYLKFYIDMMWETEHSQIMTNYIHTYRNKATKIVGLLRHRNKHAKQNVNHNVWLHQYHEHVFFQLFRLRKNTFYILLQELIKYDRFCLIRKKYRGGNYPTDPEKCLLIFLWYLGHQDTLHGIADRFGVVSSTVMNIVNIFLYITNLLKTKYIVWPKNQEEFDYIVSGFKNYPGVVGAVDGCHINVTVPESQHESYADRYQQHSINLMGICSSGKIFTYVFIGYPGSAHDSRVFSASPLVSYIQRYGSQKFFPTPEHHLIGDSAFPLKQWIMTPFKKHNNLSSIEKRHNYLLSADRVCIENAFGILKGRFRRLKFINCYSISKSVEIISASCVLHNFCYINHDKWTTEFEDNKQTIEDGVLHRDFDRQQFALGKEKRGRIANILSNNVI